MPDRSVIEALRADFRSRLATASTSRDLTSLDDEFLSRRSGSVTALLKAIATVPADERREFGQLVNALKTEIESALDDKRAAVDAGATSRWRRRRHPVEPRDSDWPHPPPDARPTAGRRHLQPHGLRDPRGPRGRRRLPQLRSAQHAAGSSRARHAGHAVPRIGRSWVARGAPIVEGCRTRRSGRRRCCAPTPLRCRSGT